MRVLVVIGVLLLVLVGVNSFTGNVVAGEEEATGFFGKIWDFFKGLFGGENEVRPIDSIAKVSVNILPGDEEDLGEDRCLENPERCDDWTVVVGVGEVFCSEESRNVDACIEIYQPVCADVRVECVAAPCDNVKETYLNSCDACREDRVVFYVEGACGEVM